MPPKTQVRFKFKDAASDQVVYECKLDCQQCSATRPNRQRCKLKTCFSLPFCHVHLKKNLGLQKKPSTIPNAGDGLFATRRFAAGEYIAPLDGRQFTLEQLDHRYLNNTAPYSVTHRDGTARDGACERHVGHLANSARGTRRGNNATLSSREDGKVWLKARQTITPGTEILVAYGPGYQMRPDAYKYTRVKNRGQPNEFIA
jgi:hypothetical protein